LSWVDALFNQIHQAKCEARLQCTPCGQQQHLPAVHTALHRPFPSCSSGLICSVAQAWSCAAADAAAGVVEVGID